MSAGGLTATTARVVTTLYGSLALTGRGHATDRAVIQGLAGYQPATIDPDAAEAALMDIRACGRLCLGGTGPWIAYDEAVDILWLGRERRPEHPNALTFQALDSAGAVLEERTYFSIGGGFVRDQDEVGGNAAPVRTLQEPYPFVSGEDLLLKADGAGLTLACGTGSCAALVAASRRGLVERTARLELDGGDLTIEWRVSDDHVIMTGPVEVEFEGVLP